LKDVRNGYAQCNYFNLLYIPDAGVSKEGRPVRADGAGDKTKCVPLLKLRSQPRVRTRVVWEKYDQAAMRRRL